MSLPPPSSDPLAGPPTEPPFVPDKPYAPSCDRNRDPILDVLRPLLADRRSVLELGSGTGQHAVHFARHLPHLSWQTSERAEHLAGIRQWLDDAALPNTPPPLELDVTRAATWPVTRYDAVFTANTLHYMPWASVQALFTRLPGVLAPGAWVVAYGPFNVDGRYTSEGNAAFDLWLKERDPAFALRDAAAVEALAAAAGLVAVERRAMPANNLCLIWRRPG